MTDGDDRPVLDYHHPDDPQFGLRHVTDDKERHQDALADLRGDADEDGIEIRTQLESVNGMTAYLVYTKEAPEEPFPEFKTDEEIVTWLQKWFDTDDLPIVLTVFRIFRGILEEKADHGNELQLYKQLQFEKLPEVIDRVEWRQSVPAVGSKLLSNFILAHPMPNANHRTAITLLDRYLTSIDPDFEMPDPGEEGEWYPWAADFVHASKRLLTLRRDVPKFRYAAAIGYELVQRKEGITIDLDDVDLDHDDHRNYYREQHCQRAREFVDVLLEHADAETLQSVTDDGKEAFVARLRADQ